MARFTHEETACEQAFSNAVANLRRIIDQTKADISHGPLPTVNADGAQLTRLFQNFIENAIKFRKPGGNPRIKVSADRKGHEWAFSVQDNGIGIEPQYSERIFQIFQKLHGREYPGTGIGLAICKKIVERHGGRIWVNSEPGKGSEFCFTISARARNKKEPELAAA